MFTKITSGNSIHGVLAYNKEKIDEAGAKVIFSNKMIESPVPGMLDMQRAMKSFEPYLTANRNTRKPIIHISLNPNPADKLTDETLAKLSREYMERMGYGKQPYIVIKHEDIARPHVHIVSVRVNEKGYKLEHGYEGRRSAAVLRELERKYDLIPMQKGEWRNSQILKEVDYPKGDVRCQIASTVRAALNLYRFGSFNEFKTLLERYNITATEIRGEADGKFYRGLSYGTLDGKGEVIGGQIKSSRIGKNVGIEAVERRIARSEKIVASQWAKAQTGEKVAQVMREAGGKADFIAALKAQQIDVIFRHNQDGRIYGVTFIDHNNRIVLNGRRLGADFSANAFERLFGKGMIPRQEVSRNVPSQETKKAPRNDPSTVIHDVSKAVTGVRELLRVLGEEEQQEPQPRTIRRKPRRIRRR